MAKRLRAFGIIPAVTKRIANLGKQALKIKRIMIFFVRRTPEIILD